MCKVQFSHVQKERVAAPSHAARRGRPGRCDGSARDRRPSRPSRLVRGGGGRGCDRVCSAPEASDDGRSRLRRGPDLPEGNGKDVQGDLRTARSSQAPSTSTVTRVGMSRSFAYAEDGEGDPNFRWQGRDGTRNRARRRSSVTFATRQVLQHATDRPRPPPSTRGGTPVRSTSFRRGV